MDTRTLPRKRKPTIRQIKALKYLSQGLSASGALRKAGYSPSSARLSTEYVKTRMQSVIHSLGKYLEDYGVNDELIAKRISEFVSAEKKEGPDQGTRIQGVKLYLDIKKNQEPQGKKREMTITEFITGEEGDT